jgi:hypothetical protein
MANLFMLNVLDNAKRTLELPQSLCIAELSVLQEVVSAFCRSYRFLES